MCSVKKALIESQKGAILIELALILPLLLVLALGFAEFGLAFYRLNVLNKVVEDGARYFDDPLMARQGGNPINPVDTSSANSNVAIVRNIVVYGQPTAGSTPVLPGFTTGNIYLSSSSYPDSNCTPTPPVDHFRLCARYQHNFMVGAVLGNLMRLASRSTSSANPLGSSFIMSASTVMRVE